MRSAIAACLAVTAWGVTGHRLSFRDGRADDADRVAVGRLCRSALPGSMQLSCGSYGFGDLRYVCPAPRRDDGTCVPTSAVTVRNSGDSSAYVSWIAGPRPGVREQGREQRVSPGREVTLRPGRGRLLFDVTLRGGGDKPSSLEVVRVR
ncbi:hypothetical protein C3492_27475 [Streptomyces sp. Ru62]|nr:hypothetical protein C3492_27475 [Streptomyces sp. Ru62]